MNKIKVLDDSTVNKIAAGEVVERPYSIVKELVENSVDALATSITVEIKNGGKSYIRVTDNGSGIEADDMELAFLRHSTSKIGKVEDLQNIITLGFRGEALASIASVSQLEVLSKTRESEVGKRLVIYSGETRETSEVGTSNGTTIIVRNLFYNIPVRKKFLKSDMAESGAISDLIYKLALGNPSISFNFIKDGKPLLKTPGNGKAEGAIYSLFGKDFIESTIELESAEKGMSVSGLISNPTFSRGNRSQQYLFVNGRSVKSLSLSKKIENVYRGVIPGNRYPVFVLFLELDPRDIDVNIHPSKTEIRFLKESELLDWIERLVSEGLSRGSHVSRISLESRDISESPDRLFKAESEKLESPVVSSENSVKNFKLLKPEVLSPPSKPDFIKNSSKNFKPGFKPGLEKKEKTQKSSYENGAKETQIDMVKEAVLSKELEISGGPSRTSRLPKLKVIGVLFNTYILCEDSLNSEFLMVDQHAAHERIMYEKLQIEYSEGTVAVQEVIAVDPIELGLSDMEKLSQYREHFSKLGFRIEDFGQNTVILRGVPLVFGKPDFRELFIDILDSLEFGIKSSYEMRLEKIMKLSCTSAVKAGDSMDAVEIERLLDELGKCEKPYTCPHGRPTVVKLSKSEIEKKFKRI